MTTRKRLSFFSRAACTGAVLVSSLALGCDPAEGAALPPPGPNAIEIAIATEPPGAAVSVDGVPLGNAPQKAKLNPGPHTIRAFKSGYFNVDQRVTVAQGEQTEHLLTLIASH
jgi:hypothetical protein